MTRAVHASDGSANGAESHVVSSELQRILERHDKRNKDVGADLRRLLESESLFPKLSPDVMATKGRIEQAILMSEGMAYLRRCLTDEIMHNVFIPLQNNPRGFLTDNRGGYSIDVVRECLIEAFTIGLSPVGNQFNILQGRMYVTRNGMTVLLKNLASSGLTDLRIDPSVPVESEDKSGAIVTFTCSWKWNGIHDEMSRRVPVRVNKGQGHDAILGKAERKIKAAIYSRVTGTVFTEEGEVDPADEVPKTANSRAADAQAGLDELRAREHARQSADGGGAQESPPIVYDQSQSTTDAEGSQDDPPPEDAPAAKETAKASKPVKLPSKDSDDLSWLNS